MEQRQTVLKTATKWQTDKETNNKQKKDPQTNRLTEKPKQNQTDIQRKVFEVSEPECKT